MKLAPMSLTSILIVILCLMIAPDAQASIYRSNNGNTELRLVELNAPRTNRPGIYTTRIGNQTWTGTFAVDVDGAPTTLSHGGTFQDSPLNNPNIQCTGRFGMTRSGMGPAPGNTMKVIWEITGGKQCPAIGKTVTLFLPEALPIANAKGDYTQSWDRWDVASPDNSLNCRATPNGTIVHTFTRPDELVTSTRSGKPFTQVNGNAWMLVFYPNTNSTKSCHVRANSQWIIPMSLPF